MTSQITLVFLINGSPVTKMKGVHWDRISVLVRAPSGLGAAYGVREETKLRACVNYLMNCVILLFWYCTVLQHSSCYYTVNCTPRLFSLFQYKDDEGSQRDRKPVLQTCLQSICRMR